MPTTRHIEAADRLREQHDAAAERIRARPELSDHGRAMLLAKSYVTARDKMGDLQRAAAADDTDQRSRTERSVFGAGGLGGDPATAVVSFRDAQDRAAGLTTSDDAAALLARAERSGDEPLARAVAGHAFDQSCSNLGRLNQGWDDVLDTYTEARPAAARDVATLRGLSSPMGASAFFVWSLPVPQELWDRHSGQLDALAAATP